jgi:hypothetical protein
MTKFGINDLSGWDDADVERFIDRLREHGVEVFLANGSEAEDPKDAVDFRGGPDHLSPELALECLAHRRDLACYLRGLRGAARMAAVAEARAEAGRLVAPLVRRMASAFPAGADIRVGGIPLDMLPDDDEDRGPPQ